MNRMLSIITFNLHCRRDNPRIPIEECNHQNVHSFQHLSRFLLTCGGFTGRGASRRSKVNLALHAPDVVGELVGQTLHAALHFKWGVAIEVVAVVVPEYQVSTTMFMELRESVTYR